MARILIGTPAYGGQVRVEFMDCLLRTMPKLREAEHSVETAYVTLPMIQRSRNILATAAFYRGDDFLLMLDADLIFSPDDIVRLVEANQPIIGLNYARKGLDWERIREAARRGVDACDLAAQGTTPAGEDCAVPAGAMLIARRVLEAFAAQPQRWYENGPNEPRECAFFNAGVIAGRFISEDFYFCAEAAVMGFEPKILPATTAHIGSIAFEHGKTSTDLRFTRLRGDDATMSTPEHSGFGGKTYPAVVNPKPNPGAQPAPITQTFGDWVKRDREWKENGAISVPKYS
jgi:hypothetical protein